MQGEVVLKKQDVSAAWIYLVVSTAIMIMKFAAYYLTNSNAIFSDALESIVNVIAAAVAFFVMRFVAEPADEEHPYGHGKMEYFSAAFEGGMIAFAAFAIIFKAVQALLVPETLRQLDYGMGVVAMAAIFNFVLSIYLNRVGQKHNSIALKASAEHVLSDVWTTGGVIIGLLLVKFTGYTWIDPVAAIIVGLQLAYSGIKIVRTSAGGLIDETDFSVLADLAKALNKHKKPGLIDVHNLRIIRSGRFHHVDAHLVVPDFWDVVKTHNMSSEFEKAVVATYPFDGEFAFHVDPCASEYCARCDMPPTCPIRKRPIEQVNVFTSQSIIKGPVKDA